MTKFLQGFRNLEGFRCSIPEGHLANYCYKEKITIKAK
jgi:hypothetical protein